ncbi:MAG: PGPGW domain-containing protein [Rhodospirillaceae bacterium]|nr:PGPGW domain-containing protein [Rhodospirillaceae bacterium]
MNPPSRFRRWLSENLPRSAWLRVPIGILLIIFGILGFLPILGFWMIPLGLAVLAIDYPPARRLGRRLVVFIGRRFKPKKNMI